MNRLFLLVAWALVDSLLIFSLPFCVGPGFNNNIHYSLHFDYFYQALYQLYRQSPMISKHYNNFHLYRILSYSLTRYTDLLKQVAYTCEVAFSVSGTVCCNLGHLQAGIHQAVEIHCLNLKHFNQISNIMGQNVRCF